MSFSIRLTKGEKQLASSYANTIHNQYKQKSEKVMEL